MTFLGNGKALAVRVVIMFQSNAQTKASTITTKCTRVIRRNLIAFNNESSINYSLRSKRFRGFFREAFFAFWRSKNCGERNTDGRSGEGEGRREKETLARNP